MKLSYSLCGIAAMLMLACNPAQKEESTKEMISEIPLIIGTYTRKEGHVDGKGKGIYIFAFDTVSGKMQYKNYAPGIINPSYVAAYGPSRTVLAVSETPQGELVSYTFDAEKDSLEEVSRVASYGDYPCHVSIADHGGQAFVANYGTGSIAAYDMSGSTILSRFWQTTHEGHGKTSRQEAAHAHMVWVNPNEPSQLFAVDLGIDKVKVYDIQDTTLSPLYDIDMPAGSGPRHIVFHPTNEEYAYVINELSGAVSLLTTDSVGHYQFQENFSALSIADSTGDAGSGDIQIEPTGKYLYASTRGNENKVTMFSIDSSTGRLTLLGHEDVKGKTPRCIQIDPSGKFLLVANQDTGNIITFKIKADGTLEEVQETKTPTPVSFAFLVKE